MKNKSYFVAIIPTFLFFPHSKISLSEKELLKLSYIRVHAFIAVELFIAVRILLLMEMVKMMGLWWVLLENVTIKK